MTVRKAMMPALMFALGLVAGCADEAADQRGTTDEQRATIDNLIELGVPAESLELFDGAVRIGGDAEITLAASRELLGLDRGTTQERWVHPNRVGATITRICVDGTAFSGPFNTPLNSVLAAYNALGLRFTFQRVTSTASCQAVITTRVLTAFSRASGYPSGGRPYPTISLGSGFSSYDASTIRHQMLHLIGHAVGLGHADLENPDLSCGPGTGAIGGGPDVAPPTGLGLIGFPGPIATVGGSVMN